MGASISSNNHNQQCWRWILLLLVLDHCKDQSADDWIAMRAHQGRLKRRRAECSRRQSTKNSLVVTSWMCIVLFATEAILVNSPSRVMALYLHWGCPMRVMNSIPRMTTATKSTHLTQEAASVILPHQSRTLQIIKQTRIVVPPEYLPPTTYTNPTNPSSPRSLPVPSCPPNLRLNRRSHFVKIINPIIAVRPSMYWS